MTQTMTETPTETRPAPPGGAKGLRQRIPPDQPWFLYAAFLILIVTFSLASPVFFSTANFANIGRQTALVSIMAVGAALVIICSEIDLSVGSVLALAGMMSALAMEQVANNFLIGALAALATGALIGLLNGVLTTRLGIPSFLVTLGTLGIARGVALMITGTAPVIITNQTYFRVFAEGSILGLSAPVVWTVIVALVGFFLLHLSVFGRKVYATGGNAKAASYSGINTRRVKTTAFVIGGTLAGLAALIFSARAHAARPDVAAGTELDVIAAVILGGTSLFGGRGTIIGVLLGSLIIGILDNGLVLLGVSSAAQLAVKGAIIIAAVAFGRK